jgi:predicted nucleotidyltransferase
MQIYESITTLHRWLNEEQEQPIDKVALATLLWYARSFDNVLDELVKYAQENFSLTVNDIDHFTSNLKHRYSRHGAFFNDAPLPNNPVKVGGIVR